MRPLLAAALLLPVTAWSASVEDDAESGASAVDPTVETATAEVRRRAVIVGANDGGSSLEQLRFAESDAERMADVLTELGGFERYDVTYLPSPSSAELDAVFAEVAAADAQDLFLFYYSGHADARGLQLGEEIYPYEQLKGRIREVDAEVHLGVLDACRSGAVTTIKGASVEAPFLTERGTVARGEAWIAASSANEDAQESALLGGSFFTYYLLSALRGAADTGDGWVSLNEAYSYAYDRTVARTAGTAAGAQHPAYEIEMEGNGDLWLTDVRKATARLRLPESSAGTVTVLALPGERPVAEVAKVEGRVVDIAVAPGRYLLRRRLDGRLQEVRLSVSDGGAVTVDRWGDATQEVAQVKGTGGAVTETEDYWMLKKPQFNDMGLPKIDPWHSPAVAGIASALLPGAGQAYDKRFGDGLLFLTSTAVLNGIGWSLTEQHRGGLANRLWPGPNLFTWLGASAYFWSIADASWGVHQRTHFRPRTGVMISVETAWGRSFLDAESVGLSIDVVPYPGVAIGLDRAGALPGQDSVDISYGGRLTFGPELARTRPELVIAAGMYSTVSTMTSSPDRVPSDVPENTFRPYVAAGGALRWYLSPRYFIRGEARMESTDFASWHLRWSGGMGFHIGGVAPRRSELPLLEESAPSESPVLPTSVEAEPEQAEPVEIEETPGSDEPELPPVLSDPSTPAESPKNLPER